MKIAIANSQKLVRDSISNMLSADSCFDVCIKAANGKELVHSLAMARQLPDACLLDVQMPGMNGYETIHILRERWPKLQVLVLSILEDEFVIKSMLHLGAKSYLGKGCTMQELQNALLSVHDTGYYCSAAMARALGCTKDKPLCIESQEYAYLKYCHTELSVKEIAVMMNVKPSVVNNYRKSLFEKLKVNTRQGLAIFALKTGIITLGDIKA